MEDYKKKYRVVKILDEVGEDVWLVIGFVWNGQTPRNFAGQADIYNVDSYWPKEQLAMDRIIYLEFNYRIG